MISFINTTTTWESRESVLFQPVLKAYPPHHSWIITACVSLRNLEKQWRMFLKQIDRTQLLKSLLQKPLAPTHLLSPLEAELTNLESIHIYYKPLILAATQLLKRNFHLMESQSVLDVHGKAFYPIWVMHSAGLQEQLRPRISRVLSRKSTNWLVLSTATRKP